MKLEQQTNNQQNKTSLDIGDKVSEAPFIHGDKPAESQLIREQDLRHYSPADNSQELSSLERGAHSPIVIETPDLCSYKACEVRKFFGCEWENDYKECPVYVENEAVAKEPYHRWSWER